MKDKNKIVIWGTGHDANKLMEYLHRLDSWSDEILAFCDNNNKREFFHGVKVITPSELCDYEMDYIVVATMYYKMIMSQIHENYPELERITIPQVVYESLVYSRHQYSVRCGKPLPSNVGTAKTAIVYTAIIGDYDNLEDPEYLSDSIRYICFTTNKKLKSDIWDIRIIDNDMDNTYKARHIKLFPEKYIDDIDTDILIWTDAKYRIQGNLLDYYRTYWRGKGLLCFPHFKWETITDELGFLIGYRPKWKKELVIQVAEYLREGLPDNYYTHDTGCLVRDTCSKEVSELMQLWWNQMVEHKNPRDQIAFRYALWKSRFETDISDLYIEDNPYLRVSRQ